jgi:hypothetical protein
MAKKKFPSLSQALCKYRFDLIRKLWFSLPALCSDVPPGGLALSYESVDFWSKFFGFGPGGFPLFLKVCRSRAPHDAPLESFAALSFPCSMTPFSANPFPFKRFPFSPVTSNKPPPGQCPICFSWLWKRELSGTPGPENFFGFGTHIFCPKCLWEKYEHAGLT